MKKVLLFSAALLLLTAGLAAAAEDWLQISGDYRFRFDSLKGTVHDYVQFDPTGTVPAGIPTRGYDVKNDALMTNRFGLNLRANALENVTMKARLVMYKVWGHSTSTPADGSFFADRAMGPNDGTSGHVPQDNTLRVDYAYATWSYIADLPVWFSVGRRPSTNGIPSNLRNNSEKVGTAGIPALMVDYAFDGLTIGYAPDIPAMPGAYVKFCYGKGYDSGYVNDTTSGTTLKDSDFFGVNGALYATENLHVELQYQRGRNIFDAPSDGMNVAVDLSGTGAGPFVQANIPVTANLGNIDWIGGIVMGRTGNLNLFLSAAQSRTDPNDATNPFGAGMLWDAGSPRERHTGTAFYLGGRYDIEPAGTRIGLEYNQGSKYWVGMVPASDDLWTAKLGTRGSVYEVYVIQELRNKPIAKKGMAFFKLGYQYYSFDYTGSNSWVGTPVRISDLSLSNPAQQMLAPVEKATDLYLTFEVRF